MTEGMFRIVVTAAVCGTALVQAVVAVAVYLAIRRIEKKSAPLWGRAEPVIARLNPILDQVVAAFEKAGPAIEKIGAMADKTGPVIERIGPMVDRVGPAVEKIGPAFEQAGLVLESANKVLAETRPRIVQITDEMVGIAKSGREQIDRVGEILHDAGSRALTRLEQIDRAVDSTVGQVEQAGEAVKRAVMTPMREVNGLAAGISAAVATLVHHSKRPQIDEATQDEEMFI